MEKEMFLKVFKWLEKEFKDLFEYECFTIENMEKINVALYTEEGWETANAYFNKEGKLISQYEKQLEIKNKIKELQEELRELQENHKEVM